MLVITMTILACTQSPLFPCPSLKTAHCKSILMPRPLPVHLASLLISKAATFNLKLRPTVTSTVQRVCETPSLLLRSSAVSPPPLRYFDDSATSSVVAPRAVHHRVGPIVAACLGAAVGVLLVGLVLFWFFLRHRLRWATAQVQDVVPRSWVSDSQGGHDIQVVANHPSMSLDLTGAECENESAVPVSARSIEAAIRLNKSSSVLDISNSVENALRAPLPSSPSPSPSSSLRRSSLPGPIEPYVPSQVPPRTPVLRIHTNVLATSSNSGPRLSPPTPAQSSRSPVRPLPTPPTTPSTRRPRSAKAEETNRQSHRSRLARSVVSAEDFRSYSQGRRRSRAHSITSVSVEMDGYDIVQHHDGGAHARIDLPPPYHECLQAQATTPAPLSVPLRTMAQP
ncbi:hypothetical protein EDB92DRAFT_1853381 [Lactarius akahatsu]|uniref:Uncharacterized protein n=1 Tax=Lactarius akahatsu TaxID=416441 RepID=A0AAD4LIA5_9AGAM|nr:hypothetical protein EDB92DRAFT_1853381 [Lactarius akahatsu]